jgi:hypothetical protein
VDCTERSRAFQGEQKKLIRAIKTGKGVAEEQVLLLHFLMKEYSGYPDRWIEQDWQLCEQLLNVNSHIQKIKERERKKKQNQSGGTRRGKRRRR